MALTKITNDLLDLGSDTGALGLPKGTEAQRPSNPVEGTLRHNSEIDETKLETFDGTDWRKINKVSAEYAVDYLVVAGGGGGGANEAAGGGAGGYRTSYGTSGGGSSAESSLSLTPFVNYTITVGAGGLGGYITPNRQKGYNGTDSLFHTITSIGGGGGGTRDQDEIGENDGSNGGSGGGAAPGAASAEGNIGLGTSGQGYNGGADNYSGGVSASGGGGGGAGSAGQNAPSGSDGGDGGQGVSSSITGTSIGRAGGGGGSSRYGVGVGVDGGGNATSSSNGINGTVNTGGGGGAAGDGDFIGGSGGSGIVILRMPTANYSGTTTGSPTVTTDGTDTILTYTSSGTYTA